MTVEELNIKITADSEQFRKGLTAAYKTLTEFQTAAVSVGRAVTSAYNGLVSIGITPGKENDGSEAFVGTPGNIPFPLLKTGGRNAASPDSAYSGSETVNVSSSYSVSDSSRTANVIELESSETAAVGAGTGSSDDTRPVEITTNVELDGEKVGEAVIRHILTRSKVTNGLG